jgi:PAS domain S-box-containing protein
VERIFGFTPEELKDRDGFDFVHPDDKAAAVDKLLHILSSPSLTNVLTIRLLDSQGRFRYCEVLAKNLLNNPHIQGVVLNIRDVHEKVEAEQRLQLSEINYRLLFEGNPQPMWIVNKTSYAFIEVNRAALNLYGYSQEEFASMTLYDIRQGSDVKKLVQWQEDHPATIGDVYDAGEWKHRRKGGDEMIVEIMVSIISYHGEEVMLVLINNVTEKKKLEKKLLEEKINRQKQITAASIRMQEKERELIGRELHDNVNQILAAAKLHIEHACSEEELQKNILSQGKEYITMAMSEIRKLSKALVPPSIGDIGLIASINDLVESFSVIENMQLNVNIDIDETLLNGVQKLTIYRVVQEQISNIIKYANASQVAIYLALNGNTVSLMIADNGIGFDKNAKKKGIGINNIKARVKALDGKTTIDTEPGCGCRLNICFPLQTAQSELLLEND